MTTGPGAIGCRLITGAIVADEICKCGHSIRHHAGPNALVLQGRVFPAGCDKCGCPRYTWNRFIFEPPELSIASPPLDATR